MRATYFSAPLALVFLSAANAADRMNVKIVDRQDSNSTYSYVVPGSVRSNSTTNVNCSLYPNSASCVGTTNGTSSVTPAQQVSYPVQGATFSLLLPDGRIAVVNCSSKANLTEWTRASRRSCRIPLVNDLQAEFDGSNAKLLWPVSIDGKKLESETYKIVAVLVDPRASVSEHECAEAVGGSFVRTQSDGTAVYAGSEQNPITLVRCAGPGPPR